MKRTPLFFSALALIGVTLATAAHGGHQNRDPWVSPTGARFRVNYGFFDPRYPDPQVPAQHLGLDINVHEGDVVYSPVSGWLIYNNTRTAAVGNSYIVIRDQRTGEEHALGHISSTLGTCPEARPPCRLYARGERVGSVRRWRSTDSRGRERDNSHLHWGANRTSVQSGGSGGGWNWGQAPLNASRSDATRRGWIDMDQHVGSMLR